MRREFYEIYKDLYEVYRSYAYLSTDYVLRLPFPGYIPNLRAIRQVTDAIEEAVTKLGLTLRLRPDAKHFLLINFHQMVILPLMHPESYREKIDLNKLLSELKDDAHHILSYAMKKTEGKKEITSGDILKACADTWGDLKLQVYGIWGETS
jgi:hypothetical protein